MNRQYCYSCGIPLDTPGVASKAEHYCIYCVDETGMPKSWEETLAGMSHLFTSWQPDITPELARERAERYLTSMPAWAGRIE